MNEDVYDRWLKVWEDAIRASGASGLTTRELTERWGVSEKTVRKRLHFLDRLGVITAGYAARETLLGEWRMSPVYFAKTGGVTGLAGTETGV